MRPADALASRSGPAPDAARGARPHAADATPDGRALAGLALLTLLWGLNWPVMKFTLRDVPPLHFRALTMTGGALLLAGWALWRGVSLRVPRAAWGRVVALALPNMLGWHLFSILGIQALASGRAAILGFTMPIWAAVIGFALFGERPSRRIWVAVACAAGAVALLLAGEAGTLLGRPDGVAWMQAAAICWALGTLGLRRLGTGLPTETLTVAMMALAATALWILAPCLETMPDWSFPAATWGALAWGVAINFGVAQILWFGMARRLPPATAGLSVVGVPMVGLATARWISGDVPVAADWVAGLLIAGALATALSSRPR